MSMWTRMCEYEIVLCVWVSNKFPTFHQILRSLGKVNTQNKPHLWVIVFVCINLLAPLCNLNESKSLIHYSTHVLRPQVSSSFFQNFLLCKIELWTEVGLGENPMEVVPVLDEVELNINWVSNMGGDIYCGILGWVKCVKWKKVEGRPWVPRVW